MCFRPVLGAAAYERRDAVYARFWQEDMAATAIACAYRWYRTREMFARRYASKVVTRAIREYRSRRIDAFRQRFVHLANYRRMVMRVSTIRLQRYYRRRMVTRRHRAANSIQSLYKESKGRWITAMLDLIHGSATLIEAAWRGRRARIHFCIAHLKLAEQHRKEIRGDAANPVLAAVSDIRAARALSSMAQHIATLKGDIARRKTGQRRNGGGHVEFSLPTSRKRHVPVYGDAPRRSFNSEANAEGRAHLFVGGNRDAPALWPRPATKKHRESLGDFDATLESYAYRAAQFERIAKDAVLETGGRLSTVPWRREKEGDSGSLLQPLAAARLAQAKRAMLVDRASAAAERKQFEEAKRLEMALEADAEEAARREKAAAAASAHRHTCATRMSSLARGRADRRAAARERITVEIAHVGDPPHAGGARIDGADGVMLGRGQIAGIAGLCALAAGAGLVWGRASLLPTETEAINAIVARYVAETGGAAADCYARPGPDGRAWITVYCDGAAGRFAYPLDRRGRAVPSDGDRA